MSNYMKHLSVKNTISSYVRSRVSDNIESAKVLATLRDFYGIAPTAIANDANKSTVDALFSKLAKKLAIAEKTTNKKSKSESTRHEAPRSEPKKRVSQETPGAKQMVSSQAKALLKKEDPVTGEALSEILLLDNTKALYNKKSRVVYPIPLTENLQEIL